MFCPSAAGTGFDCETSMDQRKLDRMMPYSAGLEAAVCVYQPFAVSCWARLYPRAKRMLESPAQCQARRRNSTRASEFQRILARVTMALMRRAARMALQCWPCMETDVLEPDAAGDEVEAAAGPGIMSVPVNQPLPHCHPPWVAKCRWHVSDAAARLLRQFLVCYGSGLCFVFSVAATLSA